MPKPVSFIQVIRVLPSITYGDFFTVVLDKYHWMLYFLVTAMYPRFLLTLDEELNSIPITVRVGQVSPLPTDHRIFLMSPTHAGCRCCRTSWQTTNNLGLPNASDTRAVRNNRTSRVGYGGVYTICTCVGGVRDLAEEPWVGEGG